MDYLKLLNFIADSFEVLALMFLIGLLFGWVNFKGENE